MSEMELFATIDFVTKGRTLDIDMGPFWISLQRLSKETSKYLLLQFLK